MTHVCLEHKYLCHLSLDFVGLSGWKKKYIQTVKRKSQSLQAEIRGKAKSKLLVNYKFEFYLLFIEIPNAKRSKIFADFLESCS